jgi:putative peptide zinc metalloprotease protein
MAVAAAAPGASALLPLREEIAIFRGPVALDGSPTWTLHDPVRNRFYRLGWTEFEILSRWDAGGTEAVAQRVNAETTLHIEPADVDELARFIAGCDLLRAATPQATAAMVAKAARLRQSVGQWLLHNYLFVRIPLVRPDRFLTATYPYVRWVYSRGFFITVFVLGLLGLYLIARQWDAFLATFVDLFTVEGIVYFAVTLAGLKVVHELGHAYTAKRFGCNVPTMGLALLVLVPVLYSDVNDSWKLTARRQRLAIGVAGVTAELCCAAIAACAWGFLPPGAARSVAFLVATSTWVTTVLINASPFMRYDGYYVLSDWLETPNLHARAFALAQWWLRAKLLGLADPPPEDLPHRRQNLLIVFAFLTWIYRFVLFIGIAVIVYHFVVKILGVVMMVVEVGYFIVRPVLAEAHTWWQRRGDVRLTPRTAITGTVFALLLGLLLVPWRSTIEAPALLRSRQHVDVFVPDLGSRVVSIAVAEGAAVSAGAPLIKLASPDVDYRIARVRTELDVLEWQMSAKGLDAELLARSQVTEREYAAALAEYRALADQRARLDVSAPITGKVVDLADGLKPGAWLKARSRLLSVIDPGGAIVEAYLDEADLERIRPGDRAIFYAEADPRVTLDLTVSEIDRGSTRSLPDPYLASVHGGPVSVRTPKQNELIPDQTIYRVSLVPSALTTPPDRVVRGQVALRGETISLAARAWRAVLAVLIRESGA